MPELPEVENVVRALRPSLVGRTVTGISIHWDRTIGSPDPQSFTAYLVGERIRSVGRRGKWIVIGLEGNETLLIHLRMTGRLIWESTGYAEDRYVRVALSLDDGSCLRFSDQRKFGRLILTDDPSSVLGDLGPEPLSPAFTVDRLARMLAKRRGRIKPLLLNQRFLAGLGNIYADESLWQARIHPLRCANTLTPEEVAQLHAAIRSVLRAAIESGGTSLPDQTYRRPDGELGSFIEELAAYGREGEPCSRCGEPIERIRVSQRSTHFCPHCQPAPGT